MIRLFLLLLSFSMFSDILEREDIKEFIDMAVENSDLKRSEIINYLKDAEPSKRAVQARSNQPEVKATWDDYLSKRVTSRRIDNGVQFLKEHIDIFESAEKDYGVSKFYIASIIGMETNYGTYYGSYNPLDTIFTRAFEPSSNFWQKELIHYLFCLKDII
jgi:Membrane-bound lytic murein transglycosylase B